MFQRILPHSNAEQLFRLWQDSYIIEKQIIEASIFPPLNRKVNDFLNSENEFFGIVNHEFLGVIEICSKDNKIHIQSLVVAPKYFRRGVATSMLVNIFKMYPKKKFTVETGYKNTPAKKLYESLGFRKDKVWITAYGIKKIRYTKRA